MIEVRMDYDKLTVGGGPKSLKVPWSDFKLDSACTRSIDSSPGGQRLGCGEAVPLEEDQDDPRSRELVLLPRGQIRDGSSPGELHDVEEGRGELRARWRGDRQQRSARFADRKSVV